MKLKIISLLLVLTVIQVVFPVYATEIILQEDLSKRIAVSDFMFVNSVGQEINQLESNGTIAAKCDVERTEIGTGDQEFVFVMAVYQKGRLKKLVKQEGAARQGSGKTPAYVEYGLGEDIAGIRIYTYLWSDLVRLDLLSSPATFGSSNCDLVEIKINSRPIGPILEGQTEYDCKLPRSEMGSPVTIKAAPEDLSANVSIKPLSSFPGTAVITVTSHDGSSQKQYQVHLDTEQDQETVLTAAKGGFKIQSNASWWIKGTLPFESEVADKKLRMRSSKAGYTGSTTYVAVIEFDLSVLPENAVITGAELKMKAIRHEVASMNVPILANLGTLDWEEQTSNYPIYQQDKELGKGLVQDNYCIISLDTGKLTEDKLVIELRREYASTEESKYTEFDSQEELPKLRISYGR